MQYSNQEQVTDELKRMGFTGKHLRDLQEVVTCEYSLQELMNFIILKGDGMSKLLLVNKFIQHMHEKSSFTCEQFVQAYSSCELHEGKERVVAKLLVKPSSPLQLNKVVEYIEKRENELSKAFALIVRYRKLYTVEEIVILLETVH